MLLAPSFLLATILAVAGVPVFSGVPVFAGVTAIVVFPLVLASRLLPTSVADPDPGSSAFLTPGSEIRDG